MIGTQHSTLANQIQNFVLRIGRYFPNFIIKQKPSSWIEAFDLLGQAIETVIKEEKKIIFFDELPWLDTKRSNFVAGLSYFWNNWAVNQNVVVVISGSAASWMIKKIINDRGGLHNRVTRRLFLSSFTLAETEEYCQARQINLNRFQLLQIYMVMDKVFFSKKIALPTPKFARRFIIFQKHLNLSFLQIWIKRLLIKTLASGFVQGICQCTKNRRERRFA